MIVQTMTPVEVYREIDKDMHEVTRWWIGKRKMLTDIAKWTVKLPWKRWFEYESSRRNRFIVQSIIMGRKYNDESLTGFVALQKMERGYAAYVARFPWQRNASRVAYLPHVFDRYRDPERGNVNKTGIDLVKHFMERNFSGFTSHGDKFSGKSVRYKGRDNVCMSIADGVLLGEDVEDIFVARTFITYDMAGKLQAEEFERKRKYVKSQKEIMDEVNAIRKGNEQEMRQAAIDEYMRTYQT